MLPARHRLRDSADFAATVRGRGGARSGSKLLVVHARRAPEDAPPVDTGAAPSARVGFVVSKAVGNSVVRNRTKRRLRHLMRDRVDVLPAGCDVVVRANPGAASASTDELAADLDRLVARVLTPKDRR